MSGWTSFSQSGGNGGRLAATEFGFPGVYSEPPSGVTLLRPSPPMCAVNVLLLEEAKYQ